MERSIGLDIGHSAVKIAAGDVREMIPTAACLAVTLSTEAALEAAKAETVKVGKQKWFVGKTALIHTNGRVPDGLRDDWIETPEHAALLKAAYARAIHALAESDAAVVLGLPSRLHASQKERLREIAATTLTVSKDKIAVLPQPMAAYFGRLIDDKGKMGAVNENQMYGWAVVDVGYYTTDFGIMGDGGIWSEAGSQSMPGTALAADNLRRVLAADESIEVSVRACEEALRTRSLRYNGKVYDLSERVDAAVAPLTEGIIENAMRAFDGGLHAANGVLVVGGGANLVFDALHARWPHAVTPEDPRFAVAEGMRRYGLAMEG